MKKKKIEEEDTSTTCSMCRHHYNERSKAYDGRMILCSCPYFKWARFMYHHHDVCTHFDRLCGQKTHNL